MKKGDFIAKPAGLENPHQFFNSGDAPMKILDVGTVAPGDVAYYPDEEIYLLRPNSVALTQNGVAENFTTKPDVQEE